MTLAILLVPLLMAVISLALPTDMARRWTLPVGALIHFVLVVLLIAFPEGPRAGGWLQLDALGRLFLGVVSLLFLATSVYAVGYLRLRSDRRSSIFVACLHVFLSMMTLVTLSHHLGLLWVAIETTTLTSAPLIYFNRTSRALEATWKYLLIGSIGIALALLGSFFLAYSALHEGMPSSLLFEDLVRFAPRLSRPWLDAAFVLLLVGYGTKMGLAPMHTWKPDAYGEAPAIAGALFAGGLTSCAFLALLRVKVVMHAAGDDAFPQGALVFIGLLSIGIAAVFLARQRDFKRMLAYSSVEHMGILALGVGIGGVALFGALLHVVNNALTKGLLFLSAGNIHRAYESKSTDEVSGALRRLPLSGGMFLAGFFAITGSPPFGPFVSEFTIVNATFAQGHTGAGVLFLVLMLVVFVGMGTTVLPIVQGRPSEAAKRTTIRESVWTGGPLVVLMGLVLMLGLWLPSPLRTLIDDAVRYMEVGP